MNNLLISDDHPASSWPFRAAGAVIFFFLLAFAQQALSAESLSGRVIRVSDGDTIVVDTGRQILRVRLAGIDAPEVAHGKGKPGQPGGVAARDVLDRALRGATVRLVPTGKSYDRLVAEVYLRDTWVNGGMVQAGWAWREPRYAKDPRLTTWEANARQGRLGLWALETRPTPPWSWRRAQW